MDGSSATPFLPCMMENQEKGDRPAVAGLVNCAHPTRESRGYFLPRFGLRYTAAARSRTRNANDSVRYR